MNLPPVCQQEGRVSGEQRPDLCPLSSGQYVPPQRTEFRTRLSSTSRLSSGMLSGDEEKIIHECKKAEVSAMAHTREDLSTHMHSVAHPDWGENLPKKTGTANGSTNRTNLKVFNAALSHRTKRP